MGRPTKFTAEARRALIEVAQVGGSRKDGSAIAGIDPTTLARWLERGETADPESMWAKFRVEFLAAEAHPKMRALGVVYRAMEDRPDLAWKFIERRVDGYAPPTPNVSQPTVGPVVFQLAFSDGLPSVPTWMQNVVEAEVIDESESPALGDGSSADATPA